MPRQRGGADLFRGRPLVESFRFGLALHIGTVLYGNIGGGNRLDFTCIGPAVNLAARLEKIASNLRRTVVASASFAEVAATGAGPISASFRSPDFPRRSGSTGWRTKCRCTILTGIASLKDERNRAAAERWSTSHRWSQ